MLASIPQTKGTAFKHTRTLRRTRMQILVNIGTKTNANITVNTMTYPPTSTNSITTIMSSRNMIANTEVSISISISIRSHVTTSKATDVHKNAC